MIGQNLRASDIPLSGSMKLISAPEQVIAHVVTMKAEEVVAPVAEAGAEVGHANRARSDQEGKKEEEGAEPEKAEKPEKVEKEKGKKK